MARTSVACIRAWLHSTGDDRSMCIGADDEVTGNGSCLLTKSGMSSDNSVNISSQPCQLIRYILLIKWPTLFTDTGYPCSRSNAAAV